MKVIVAGSRTINDYSIVERAIKNSGYQITEIVSGRAQGVDKVGELVAKNNKIPVKPFEAQWNKYGSAAGPIRNGWMADYADAAVIVWDGISPGSQNMMQQMIERGKPYYLLQIEQFDYSTFEHAMAQAAEHYRDQNITAIVGIPRGGLIPAAVLSYKLNAPMFSKNADVPANGTILLVDDIIDSGDTIKQYLRWFEVSSTAIGMWNGKQSVQPKLKIATLYHNIKVVDVVPDWTYRTLDREFDHQYIKFWWE